MIWFMRGAALFALFVGVMLVNLTYALVPKFASDPIAGAASGILLFGGFALMMFGSFRSDAAR